MPSQYTRRVSGPLVCSTPGCTETLCWNGRGRPPERCPAHRAERGRWIRRRCARRARAIQAGQLPAPKAVCIESGCDAPVETTSRPKGGRSPERCPEHRAMHRRAMRKHHRQSNAGAQPRTPTLLPAPAGPGRGAVQRERAAETRRLKALEPPPPPAPRCGCGVRLHGAKARTSGTCHICRTRAERRAAATARPRCGCGRALRCAQSKAEGRCWSCRAVRGRTTDAGRSTSACVETPSQTPPTRAAAAKQATKIASRTIKPQGNKKNEGAGREATGPHPPGNATEHSAGAQRAKTTPAQPPSARPAKPNTATIRHKASEPGAARRRIERMEEIRALREMLGDEMSATAMELALAR